MLQEYRAHSFLSSCPLPQTAASPAAVRTRTGLQPWKSIPAAGTAERTRFSCHRLLKPGHDDQLSHGDH
ncbi:unnamed protein product [Pleuronectes platessa]|uniref:Uncharacterized protein n=1 Tax=Pleuronectes platessa TaxID=8262 RepID=A0A9N7TUN9_PLEPL|nr:unnamed protein product [Pleuronectes platessa]